MPLTKLINAMTSSDDSSLSAVKLCVAVLLLRLVRSDGKAEMLELVSMSELLRKEFSLSQEALEKIFALANEKEIKSANTETIVCDVCKELDGVHRVELLEYLWRLAFADDKIDDAEVSLIQGIASQLELSELEQVTAQENAENHLGLHLFV